MRIRNLILIITLLTAITPDIAKAQSLLPQLIPIPTALPSIDTVMEAENLTFVDLIIEGRTYVPYFYEGRSEPTPGNIARAVAILPPEITATDFQWQIGNQYIKTTNNFVDFIWPRMNRELLINLTVTDSNNHKVATVSESVQASSPEVFFYEINSLRGISEVAVRDPLILIGDEVSIKAEPYFFGFGNLLSTTAGTWNVREVEVVTDVVDWRIVSLLRKEGFEQTKAEVTLNIRNLENLAESLMGQFRLSL